MVAPHLPAAALGPHAAVVAWPSSAVSPLAVVDYAPFVVPFVVAALVVALVLRSVVMLGEGQYHVITEDGEVTEVLDEGFYVRSPLRTGWSIDTEPVKFTLAGRTVETADGVQATGRITGRFHVEDPETLVSKTREFPGDVRRRIDEAYVTQLERLEWDAEDDPQATLEEKVESESRRALERWGVELESLAVERLERAD